MNTVYTDSLDSVMTDRQQVYALLARLWQKEVDDELLISLKDSNVFETDDETFDASLSMIRDYLASDEASTLDLARDYAKGFCGAGSTKMNSAYPFESVYTSPNQMLMQEARDKALEWYHQYGLTKSEDWHDCEDQLGLELEFEEYLISQYQKAREDDDQERATELLNAQRDFAREHLANWLPKFAKDANHKARTGFYRGLAKFTNSYVKSDLAALDDVIRTA